MRHSPAHARLSAPAGYRRPRLASASASPAAATNTSQAPGPRDHARRPQTRPPSFRKARSAKNSPSAKEKSVASGTRHSPAQGEAHESEDQRPENQPHEPAQRVLD